VSDFFRDHLGSAAYVTGPNLRQAYEPFGKEILSGPVTKDEFTGKRYHNATNMYYFGARWYDSRRLRRLAAKNQNVSEGDGRGTRQERR